MFDAGGFGEVGSDRVEFEDVGTVGVGDLGNAEAVGSDDAGEAAQGVGELVRVFDAAMEELVLRVSWESGNELEMEFIDGRGSGEVFEMRMEGVEKDVGRKTGLGHFHGAGIAGTIFEGKVEGHLGGGALVVGETIAEGLEEASGDEENGFVIFHGRFEDVADLKDT